MKRKGFRKKAMPVVLAASLTFSGLSLPGVTVFASEQQKVKFNEELHTPAYMVGEWDTAEGISKEEAVYLFLQQEVLQPKGKSLSGNVEKQIEAGKSQFKIIDKVKDNETNTEHFRTVETYNDIPIYGSEQTIAVGEENQVSTYFGKVTPNLARTVVSTEAELTEDDALDVVKNDIEKEIGEVKNYDGIDSELVLYPEDGDHTLVYYVKASTSKPAPGYFHYFVDATTGEVINDYDAVHEIAPTLEDSREDSFSEDDADDELPEIPEVPQIPDPEDPDLSEPVTSRGIDIFGNMLSFESILDKETNENFLYDGTRGDGVHTFQANRMPETAFILLSALLGLTGFEVTSNSDFFYDPAAVSAHVKAGKVYDYYEEVFDRDSLDDEGTKLISTVHVGSQWNNAAWNGKQMMYGDGDGELMISTSGSLDVIGHEMTHGVITNTADLIYEDESGALNESLADIMGAFIEDKTGDDLWLLGEDIYMPHNPDVGLRDMKDPASVPMALTETGFYPDHYDDRYLGEEDNGGVHINSSINNKAAHLITDGGTHYDVTVEGIGKDKAEKIFYRTITHYLAASSDFSEMRQAAIQAAEDLYGEGSTEVESVMAAYDAVGVQ
nr:M4 family metallopeptidase [Virgibacillus sp. MSJ-26]